MGAGLWWGVDSFSLNSPCFEQGAGSSGAGRESISDANYQQKN